MEQTRLSVLLPNYNNGPYLKEALDSLFAQTYSNFIVYLVDDCSTDDSIAIAKSYKDDRLKIIEKDSNSGIVDTMNVALNAIETEYYIRMDGDDISTPGRFEILLKYMDEHPEIGVCSSSIKTFGIEEKVRAFEKDATRNKANLIFGHSIGHASSIFRTSVMKENAIKYVDRFWRLEDYYLFYRLKDLTSCTAILDQLYLYRQAAYNNNAEITQRKNLAFKEFYEMVLTDLGVEANEKNLSIHLQLNNRGKSTFGLKDYQNHIELLRQANKKSLLYPVAELELVLNQHMEKMYYRLIDQKKITFVQIMGMGKGKKALLKYYLGTRLGKK
ncbi:MAG: glycosyltransferase involved in cell wall biosynthesis [Crocinitomix sp.]|jgi:glycosyltransferase involved in cell wall biosynthesis